MVKERCPRCGAEATVHIGQAMISQAQLVWSRATKCEHCGFAQEADDLGFPPQIYREPILAQDGAWAVVTSANADRRVVALVAKEAFHLSSKDALVFGSKVPGHVWAGTECEANWLRVRLEQRGVHAEVLPAELTS